MHFCSTNSISDVQFQPFVQLLYSVVGGFLYVFFFIYIFVRLLDNLLKIQHDSRLRATSNN